MLYITIDKEQNMSRPSGRLNSQLRNIKFTRNYTKHAEGSVLVEYGDTKVICTASFVPGVPRFLKGKKQGWLTAEYGMLPRSTNTRMDREASRGKQSSRTQEIQRLIGRSLRSAVNLKLLRDNTIFVDCDVIQADGGTRTASISGGFIAVADCISHSYSNNLIIDNPLNHLVASVSVGIFENEPILDLDYLEDFAADTDMNIVMNENEKFIEIQGTAEGNAFSHEEFNKMLNLAKSGIAKIMELQKQAIDLSK